MALFSARFPVLGGSWVCPAVGQGHKWQIWTGLERLNYVMDQLSVAWRYPQGIYGKSDPEVRVSVEVTVDAHGLNELSVTATGRTTAFGSSNLPHLGGYQVSVFGGHFYRLKYPFKPSTICRLSLLGFTPFQDQLARTAVKNFLTSLSVYMLYQFPRTFFILWCSP